MVQISGKYKLVENKKFYEFLTSVGVSEAKAREDEQARGTLEISIDGDNIKMENDSPKYVTNLVVGKEVDEPMGEKFLFKSTAKLEGNIITIISNTKEGKHVTTRTLTFSDSGLEVTIAANKNGNSFTANRIYKRI